MAAKLPEIAKLLLGNPSELKRDAMPFEDCAERARALILGDVTIDVKINANTTPILALIKALGKKDTSRYFWNEHDAGGGA